MRARRLIVGGSVLAVAALALVAATRMGGKKASKSTPSAALPTAADPSLGTITVGAASSYAPTQVVLTGPVDYSHIGQGWSVAGTWSGA